MKKAWQGRFDKELNEEIENFTSGEDILYDHELIEHDIRGTEAHDIMLNKIGIIPDDHLKLILGALEDILEDYRQGNFKLQKQYEDVHLNIEKELISKLGSKIAGNIHVARSRNDQILVDIRLFLKKSIIEIINLLSNLAEVILNLVPNNVETLMVAYTHMQRAQPISFGFWCMAQVTAIIRNIERLSNDYKFINVNPLGAAAIAGTSWPIDRYLTADLLGFDEIQENALDVISSRGEFEASVIFSLSTISNHLNKIAMDFLLWSTPEFGIITFDDAVTTGSSIMPQKKNLDASELIKAKHSMILGNLFQVLNILKGLPSGYNRDTQEIKIPLFNSIKTIKSLIRVSQLLFENLEINKERANEIFNESFVTATELIDLIMKKFELDFRKSHEIVGGIIKYMLNNKLSQKDLNSDIINLVIKDSLKMSVKFEEKEIKNSLDPFKTIKKRNHIGGPAPSEVLKDHKRKKEKLNKIRIENKIRMEKNDLKKLQEIIHKYKKGDV